MLPTAGDIVWTEFDPVIGREQAGRRPALILSSADFTGISGFAVVAPITSRIRRYPTSVVLPEGFPISGEILLGNLRSIDLRARPMKATGFKIHADVAAEVRSALARLITI